MLYVFLFWSFPFFCLISTEKTCTFNKKTSVYKLPGGAIYEPPCGQRIDNQFFAIHQGLELPNEAAKAMTAMRGNALEKPYHLQQLQRQRAFPWFSDMKLPLSFEPSRSEPLKLQGLKALKAHFWSLKGHSWGIMGYLHLKTCGPSREKVNWYRTPPKFL